jgi:hypothetical protein
MSWLFEGGTMSMEAPFYSSTIGQNIAFRRQGLYLYTCMSEQVTDPFFCPFHILFCILTTLLDIESMQHFTAVLSI